MKQKTEKYKLEKMFKKTTVPELPGIEINVLKPDSREEYFRTIHVSHKAPQRVHHDPKIKLRLV